MPASRPRLFSYVVARDFGFAPNPFYGVCTLATCKPQIRKSASVGDWILGTGSAGRRLGGRAIFAMRVDEAMGFDEYWRDPRFADKQPRLNGSRKAAYGDNIYSRHHDGGWVQADSHHSLADGSPNQLNVLHDTQTDRVLISSEYIYWGDVAPEIPERLRAHGHNQDDACAKRGHRCNFADELVADVISWITSRPAHGQLGRPTDWP